MKIALGTAQFGLDYGISNNSGKVPIGEVKDILDFAISNDINTLDTATVYGDSEKVLGEVGVGDFNIITKTIPLKGNSNNVVDAFYQSLNNLKRSEINSLLIHDINDVQSSDFEVLFDKLIKLKEEGLIKKIGFSTYTPSQVDFLLTNFDFDLIQLPFNVFDTRLIEGGQLKSLKNHDVEIHARSTFLQGVLVDFESLSDYFLIWKKYFDEYQSIVKESGLSLLSYALNFSLNIHEIDKVLVGVNSKKQLTEIIKEVKREISIEPYPINDVNLLNPSLWKA